MNKGPSLYDEIYWPSGNLDLKHPHAKTALQHADPNGLIAWLFLQSAAPATGAEPVLATILPNVQHALAYRPIGKVTPLSEP